MSTSSTSSIGRNTASPGYIAIDLPTDHIHRGTARQRAQSAPAMFQLLQRHAPTLTPTDEELETLIKELKGTTIVDELNTEEKHKSVAAQVDASSTEFGVEDINCVIDDLFQSQLSEATQANDDIARQRGLQIAAGMLKNMDPAMRTAARFQILTVIGEDTPTAGAEQLLSTLVDDFVAAHRQMNKEQASPAAQEFVESLSYVMADFSVRAKCKLLVHQLWAAKKLDCFTMAKVAIDMLGEAIVDGDPETTAGNIAKAAAYIDAMPIRYSLMVATELYQCAPDESPWQLHSLQAIANKNVLLPETAESQSFCRILNQQIYELRLDDADDL